MIGSVFEYTMVNRSYSVQKSSQLRLKVLRREWKMMLKEADTRVKRGKKLPPVCICKMRIPCSHGPSPIGMLDKADCLPTLGSIRKALAVAVLDRLAFVGLQEASGMSRSIHYHIKNHKQLFRSSLIPNELFYCRNKFLF
jgi:hypothetical protein